MGISEFLDSLRGIRMSFKPRRRKDTKKPAFQTQKSRPESIKLSKKEKKRNISKGGNCVYCKTHTSIQLTSASYIISKATLPTFSGAKKVKVYVCKACRGRHEENSIGRVKELMAPILNHPALKESANKTLQEAIALLDE